MSISDVRIKVSLDNEATWVDFVPKASTPTTTITSGTTTTTSGTTTTITSGGTPTVPAPTDKFGVKKIFQTKTGGREWFSKWGNGHARSVLNGDVDDAEFKPSGDRTTMSVDGAGILTLVGAAPRFSAVDNNKPFWSSVEMTAYFYETGRTSLSLNPLALEARNGDFLQTYPDGCAEGFMYGAGIRHDNSRTFIQKEVIDHCAYTATIGFNQFNGNDFPLNQWVGLKNITRETSAGTIVVQVWIDAKADNNWVKVAEKIDRADWFAEREATCTKCMNRPMNFQPPPTNGCRFRADYVNKLLLKDCSVREIVTTTA